MEQPKNANQSDEIDLGQLFSKIGDFFVNIGLGIMRFFALLRRIPIENKLLFIVVVVLTVGAGISYSSFRKKIYQTTMILSSNYLNTTLLTTTITKSHLLPL